MIYQRRSETHNKILSLSIVIIIFIVYMLLRGYAWRQNQFLEDHDSISYMAHAKMFLNLEWENLKRVDVDSTPFYPFMTAVFSSPGWDVEIGARLCNMFFSGILFLSMILIGKRFASNLEIAVGLLLLTFSPIFIPLSFAVLTEPAYIGIIYLGFAIYVSSYDKSTVPYAVLLGIIFGVAFLNRIEGIIYIAVIPFFHAIYYWLRKKSLYDGKKFILFNCLYVLVFLSVISPQIYSVSSRMGRFALNGREAWSLILHNPDGKSYEEKLHGLSYSEKEVNLKYIQEHPETQKILSSNISSNFKKYISDVVNEYNILYQNQIGILIGPLGLIFFTLGFVTLYQRGNYFELFFISFFIVSSLIPPLMHNVAMRHIAIIGPIILLMEGIGITHVGDVLSEKIDRHSIKYILPFLLLIIIVCSSVIPLRELYDKNQRNEFKERYYDNPDSYREAADIIREISGKELEKHPKILTRKTYISYYAEGEYVPMPYTDYNGLVKYSRLNNVNFLYLADRFLSSYPFLKEFIGSKAHPHFLLIYETRDPYNRLIRLYRFIQSPNVDGSQRN